MMFVHAHALRATVLENDDHEMMNSTRECVIIKAQLIFLEFAPYNEYSLAIICRSEL